MKLGLRMGLNSRGAGGGGDIPSLDLQFATDKSLTARRGPTPTFTRASAATYYGQLIDVSNGGIGTLTALATTTVTAGRASWFKSSGGVDITVYYNGSRWVVDIVQFGEGTIYQAALGSEFRPDQANWSGSGVSITTSSTFGIVRAATNEPRFDHATTAPNACRGLLIEEQRTNLVFPSETLTTQTRTVTATAHTLSFYGTGTVVLSGVSIATVTGTGAFPTRTTLTFTPTAGSLTLTVTGSVTQAQLEIGSFPTSYIPTVASSVFRADDICTITGASFTSLYNQSEGTLFTQSTRTATNLNGFTVALSDNSFNNALDLRYTTVTSTASLMNLSNVQQLTGFNGTITSGASTKQSVAYKLNDCAYSLNGASAITDTSASIPTLNRMNIGSSYVPNVYLNGHIAAVRYFKKRLANAKLQSITA